MNVVSRDWKSLLTWQVVDPGAASVPELLQAPIIFFNGHQAPEFSAIGQARTSASTSSRAAFSSPRPAAASKEFDQGFRQLMKEIFPEAEYQLRPLSRGSPGLAGQAPALARHPSALGHRARLPHGRDLLATRPLVLLEPVRDAARPTPA